MGRGGAIAQDDEYPFINHLFAASQGVIAWSYRE